MKNYRLKKLIFDKKYKINYIKNYKSKNMLHQKFRAINSKVKLKLYTLYLIINR